MSERSPKDHQHTLGQGEHVNQPTVTEKAVTVGASWVLDFAKGFSIDAIAVGSVALGPLLLPEATAEFIRENVALTVGGTYAMYMFARYVSMKADIKLQELTGITTNAWGKTAQTLAETVMPRLKEKDYTPHFQTAGELLKFLRDEAVFLVPTIGYGVITDKVWESIFFLNVGSIFGYLIRIGLQENPLMQRFLHKVTTK